MDESEDDSEEDEAEDEDEEEEDEGEDDSGEESDKMESPSTMSSSSAPSVGLLGPDSKDPVLKAAAVVKQLKVWDGVLEQRILLQELLTKVNKFPQDLGSFLEEGDIAHAKSVEEAGTALETMVRKCGEV